MKLLYWHQSGVFSQYDNNYPRLSEIQLTVWAVTRRFNLCVLLRRSQNFCSAEAFREKNFHHSPSPLACFEYSQPIVSNSFRSSSRRLQMSLSARHSYEHLQIYWLARWMTFYADGLISKADLARQQEEDIHILCDTRERRETPSIRSELSPVWPSFG